jgi:ABC-type lipoprotein release transport system permease subunit
MLFQLAWRNLWRQGRRTLITAVAMSVAVAMCMAMMALQDGMFRTMFNVMVEQQLGHLQIHHPDYPTGRKPYDTVRDARATRDRIEAVATVDAAAGRLEGAGLVGGEKESTGGQLVGIDPSRERLVTKADQRVVEGRFLDDEAKHEILLGTGLAKTIDAKLGDSVLVVTQAADGSMGNDVYDVVGLFQTGSTMLDKTGTMLHVDDLQVLLALDDQVHKFTVLGTTGDDLPAMKDAVAAVIPAEAEVLTWQEASPQTAQMMGMQNVGAAIFLGVVFAVASFGVLNTMLMSVFERTRELGVLKAIGMRPGRILVLVVIESVLLACLAGAIGLVFGGLLDAWLVVNGIRFGDKGMAVMGITLDPVIYGVVRPEGVVMVLGALVLVSVLASLYPGWRASRLVPVDAMRVND